MAVTIKDVARRAGVSIATVSRVLNKKDRVKDETRIRVEAAISELHFQPDPIARTMIVKETKTIGLLVPTLSNEYWALFSEAIQDVLWSYGYTVMLCATGDTSSNRYITYLKNLIDRKMDGIVFSIQGRLDKEHVSYINQLIASGMPVVALDCFIPGVHRVSGDHMGGAMMAVEHLIGLGHQKIAYIHGNGNISDERELGYRNALTLHGIPYDEKLLVRTQFGVKYGYDAVLKLLDSGASFSSIFCWNDLLAFGAIQALQERGLRVPEDIAVVGYDNISMTSLVKPSLTTVSQPIREIASSIVKLLLECIDQREPKLLARNINLQMKLMVRDSCGARLKGSV